MNSEVIEILTPRYGIAWYPWAVQYFFMIAISYSALLLTVPGLLMGKRQYQALARVALLVTVSCTLVGPVALLADLHQPLRFWHFYANLTPWSWMWLGSLLLPLYLILVVAYAWLAWRPAMQLQAQGDGWIARLSGWISLGAWQAPRWMLVMCGLGALLMSFGIMLYTGAEVAIVKARPLWNTYWLPVMFVLTGIVAAAGLVMVINRLMTGNDEEVNAQSLKVVFSTMVLAALVAALWVAEGLTGFSASVEQAFASLQGNPEWRAVAIYGLLVGVVLTLTVVLMLRQHRYLRHAWIAGLLAVHIGWTFRWMVLMEVQTVAKNTAGYYQYVLEMGSSGLLGILGTFGLWLAALLIIDILVPWKRDFQAGTH
ncbi:polysulfide reductase NrfD [Marinobacter daepoensis]|uniref:Polysulfide reductase NrfD n=1 Tax=Marinobacter daepoensis TaxID=262077 RepID=A0ABS3BJI1_9GAMM|nr:NrfD/PsrC family molybdoenzyme membrane anchor subunit [Marinobacter daepoensis]MBN7771731.1 polysulfide reductase NrfD [Marinobacter daepoensis]MBY6080909.1 polysulfide reductase NrfD [Marinobacter daepoensis]